MAGSYPDNVNPGLFLPTTEIFDVGDLVEAGVNNEQFRELLVRLSQASNNSNIVVNKKTSGLYVLEEFVDGNLWFETGVSSIQQRQEFRKVFVLINQLLNAATLTVAHGITMDANTTITDIYGAATNTTSGVKIKLPFTAVTLAVGNIELYADNTNFYITPVGDATGFNICYVVLEYLKN
jgi:hypothetical protein